MGGAVEGLSTTEDDTVVEAVVGGSLAGGSKSAETVGDGRPASDSGFVLVVGTGEGAMLDTLLAAA